MVVHSYDFHTHTSASDGMLAPSELLERAAAAGLKYLSITDHDTVGAYHQVSLQDIPSQVSLISGVELTCRRDKQILHVLGLNLDITDQAFVDHLSELDQLRYARAQAIANRLIKQGLPDLLDAALACAGGGQIGRPHFAQAMTNAGVVPDASAAFKKFLGAGKPGDVKTQWPALETVLDIIKGAGGLSVLAHPTKYNLTLTKVRYLVEYFKEAGGDALEISYPAVTQDQQRTLIALAEKHQLLVSAGSDFHDPAHHWTSVGRFPAMPSNLSHVLDVIVNT